MRHWLISYIFLTLLPLNPFSQVSTPPQSEGKMALVIGNGNYPSNILANPENDARAMESVLKKLGFVVYKYENLNQTQMKKAIDDFGARLKGNEVALFFYAGHGIQTNGYNYLLPVDAQPQSENEVEYECVQADRILTKMETSGTKVNIIILDACRNNPFERSWMRSSNGRGLAFMKAPRGSLIAYATSPGSTASDGSGKNGLYTSAILESIIIPKITIMEMFQNVRNIVVQKSNDKQIPWESTSLTGNFYFNTGDIAISTVQEKPQETPSNEFPPAEETYYIFDAGDNQQYKIVKIGKQVWMIENLKTAKYNDGTAIPMVIDDNAWSKLTTPGYCWYSNDTANKDKYGALYNWYTVNTGKLCPVGWHVPTLDEWATFEKYLIANGFNYSGTTKGYNFAKALASTTGWASSIVTGTIGNMDYPSKRNATGFTALPGGYRYPGGEFASIGLSGSWWSSTGRSFLDAWYWNIYFNYNGVTRSVDNKRKGFSVRCLRD